MCKVPASNSEDLNLISGSIWRKKISRCFKLPSNHYMYTMISLSFHLSFFLSLSLSVSITHTKHTHRHKPKLNNQALFIQSKYLTVFWNSHKIPWSAHFHGIGVLWTYKNGDFVICSFPGDPLQSQISHQNAGNYRTPCYILGINHLLQYYLQIPQVIEKSPFHVPISFGSGSSPQKCKNLLF